MKKIKKVKIEGFWGDKEVLLKFKEDVNFLIGVNGSGKTTIINLIAASLKADFTSLDKIQFHKIRIDFFTSKSTEQQAINILTLFSEEVSGDGVAYIEVEKTAKENSPYPNIVFRIKSPLDDKMRVFQLNELEEESFFRFKYAENLFKTHSTSTSMSRDINNSLSRFINLTWLSIHRTSSNYKAKEDNNFESSIDQKVKELSIDLIRYFGVIDKLHSIQTEKFQKNVFLSLIDDKNSSNFLSFELDSEKERESLRQIFLLFKLKETEFADKLENHFTNYELAKDEWKKEKRIETQRLTYILSTLRIHSIVQEWNLLNQKKIEINKPKFTFIEEINNLFQRKKIVITERNELLVETDSKKVFPLYNLSSGEKQLLIILGQSLIQENKNHIYIADEPELSLHVEWQEKLVGSLKKINPNSQIIFATHSPDIVGEFENSVISVERAIKNTKQRDLSHENEEEF